VRWTLLVVFPVLWYLVLSRRGAPTSAALLPALPFACVLAATAVISGVSLLRRFSIPRAPRTALITALTVAALLPPSVGAVRYVRSLRRPTTAAAAWLWISSYVSPGRGGAVEQSLLRLPEERYPTVRVEHLGQRSAADYRRAAVSFLVAGPPDNAPAVRQRTEAVLAQAQEVVRFAPEAGRTGPEIRIYELR
jgi:hypothetical protein